ncbi:MAG: 5-formyltetrahydrofolate cyclo-ligase [Pseudomonadota bacterium]
MDKKALRKAMAARRAKAAGGVDQAPARAALQQVLEETEGAVSFFWPIRTEIDARPVMTDLAHTRTVCLPVTQGAAALVFRRWTAHAKMDEDGFGVPVPVGTHPVIPTVLVVPLLGFDDAGHRLGYGGGHYDRTLAALRSSGPVLAVGFAFEAQRLDAPLPLEPTDQPLDILVTEVGVRRLN